MPVFHQPHNSTGNHSYNVCIYDHVDYGLHFHKNYEFIYVMHGSAACSVNGKTKVVREGQFAVCLSNEIHSIKSIDNSKVWIGVFSEDFIHEFAKCHKGKTGEDFVFECSDSLMAYLLDNLIKDNLSNVFVIKSCLYALCAAYLQQITLKESVGKDMSVMGEIVDFVEKNYKTNVSLKTLAASLGYEYCYFSKLFNRLFSMSFNDYINTYRFNEACSLLTASDLAVTEIVYESGFQSVRSFNNTFKKLSGVSPTCWRNLSEID